MVRLTGSSLKFTYGTRANTNKPFNCSQQARGDQLTKLAFFGLARNLFLRFDKALHGSRVWLRHTRSESRKVWISDCRREPGSQGDQFCMAVNPKSVEYQGI